VAVRVVCHDLTKHFPPRTLFRGVSVTVEPHSLFAVTGRNGAGKTTLLKIIAGLVPSSCGSVHFSDGGRILSLGEIRQTIGMVAPDLALYDALSGLENLAFFAEVRGVAAAREQIAELLELVGLTKRRHDPVATYSSGMKQRLQYAHALLHTPSILILDEPTSNLDSAGAQVVYGIMQRQRQHGSVVYATNDAREVALADAILQLD